MKFKIKYAKLPDNIRGIYVDDSARFFREDWINEFVCDFTVESTPFMPDGLFYKMYKEAQEKDETDKG